MQENQSYFVNSRSNWKPGWNINNTNIPNCRFPSPGQREQLGAKFMSSNFASNSLKKRMKSLSSRIMSTQKKKKGQSKIKQLVSSLYPRINHHWQVWWLLVNTCNHPRPGERTLLPAVLQQWELSGYQDKQNKARFDKRSQKLWNTDPNVSKNMGTCQHD